MDCHTHELLSRSNRLDRRSRDNGCLSLECTVNTQNLVAAATAAAAAAAVASLGLEVEPKDGCRLRQICH